MIIRSAVLNINAPSFGETFKIGADTCQQWAIVYIQ
jgi:hypothetical protein